MAQCFGVDAGGQVERGDLLDFGAQFGGVLVHGDGVQVHDAENALVVVLDADPVLQRAEIISDVQVSGGLHSGEDSCFHCSVMGGFMVREVASCGSLDFEGNFYPKQF